MRIFLFHIIIIITLSTCSKKLIQQPILLNNSSTIELPTYGFNFKSLDRNWTASLQSFIQPLPLEIKYNDSGFTVLLKNKFGIIEGPAQLILTNSNETFFYSVNLKNKTNTALLKKDYRSTKTVNPDSSLQHQRMTHTIDAFRNLLSINNVFFKEEIISLAPQVATYRAIQEQPLTSYYVQAGSCTSIKIKSEYVQEKKQFKVSTSFLTDKYNNQVANGTTVAFIYNDEKDTYRMEVALLNGMATAFIPNENKNYTVIAKINNTTSNSIQLSK